MSELKEIGIRWEENGELHFGYVYPKSEADNVIADLEESHKKEVEQLLMEIVKLKDKAGQYKVLYKEKCRDINTQERFFAEERAHDKYKRCLDNAWWCRKLINIYAMHAYNHRGWKIEGYFDKKEELHHRWYKRWLELAEKFKEEK